MFNIIKAFVFVRLLSGSFCSLVIDNDDFTIWRIGSSADVKTASIPGAALIGGGSDCVEAFEWQISHAKGGDFLVLRASGADDYNEWILDLSKASGNEVNSVTTVVFKNRNASTNSDVLSAITSSEAIFFAGGDQSRYINYWANTPVQQALQVF